MPARRPLLIRLVLCWLALLAGPSASAKIQFDVFPGYDSVVRGGTWYPMGLEVFNDGPSFNAVIELNAGQFGGQVVRVPVELPTNTRKRLVVPLFSQSPNFLAVEARLLDDRGKVRDERTGQRISLLGWEIPLLGALPASFAGTPAFPDLPNRRPEWMPRVARLQPEFFPDNPIALEGLNALYLNSARALELKEPQVQALLGWVHGGGLLLVAVDQPGDINATPWLRGLVPAEVGNVTNARAGTELHRWVVGGDWTPEYGFMPAATEEGANMTRNRLKRTRSGPDPYVSLPTDAAFAQAEIPLVVLRPRGGQAVVSAGDVPLLVSAPRGRGLVVVLAVNPEREPLKSWKLRPWFFARLVDVPPRLLGPSDVSFGGGAGLDGLFGAMIETRQIRKLPVGFLLLLLVVYLAVIGPFDQWWLRKINRPMLTWITFPAYVVLFSLLIYFIGYKLRAGQTEWNELHVVDVLPQGDGSRAGLRGWTFGSLYSPANETYPLASAIEHSALRGEFKGLRGGEDGRVTVTVKPPGFEAQVFVPVWTSALNVTDWQESDEAPLVARRTARNQIEVRNTSRHRLGPVFVVLGDEVLTLESLPAGTTRPVEIGSSGTRPLAEFLSRWQGTFQGALNQRNEAFGGNDRQHIDDWPAASAAAAFPSQLSLNNGGSRDYIWPAGFDLAPSLRRGDAVVLAWLPDQTLVPPLNKFGAVHSRKATLLRLAVPMSP